MRLRFILSETWSSLKRNVPMLLSVMLVTFISFLSSERRCLPRRRSPKPKAIGIPRSKWWCGCAPTAPANP